jgi:hypothetical protein
MSRAYVNWTELQGKELQFALGTDRTGKPQISMFVGDNAAAVSCISPACVTNWPRVTGDGNFGTMWGPTDIAKAKFTIDLTDAAINDNLNANFGSFSGMIDTIDNALLRFVHSNQLKILGRKNLSMEEVRMLQIRSVRPKYDKISGALVGHSLQLSASKFAWDACGGKYARVINVCDHAGSVVTNGAVQPGDVVAATMFANQVYCGVGGDKFGVHWSMEDVQVVCQRSRLAQKTTVPVFGVNTYEYAMPYSDTVDRGGGFDTQQFSEPITVA